MNRILSAVSPESQGGEIAVAKTQRKEGRRSPGSNGRLESGRPIGEFDHLPAKRPHPGMSQF